MEKLLKYGDKLGPTTCMVRFLWCILVYLHCKKVYFIWNLLFKKWKRVAHQPSKLPQTTI